MSYRNPITHMEMSSGKTYEIDHRDGTGQKHTEVGKVISLDEEGFVVIEKNGERILIRKDLIDIMREVSQE